jgi:hypothetical protein
MSKIYSLKLRKLRYNSIPIGHQCKSTGLAKLKAKFIKMYPKKAYFLTSTGHLIGFSNFTVLEYFVDNLNKEFINKIELGCNF